MKNLLKRLWGQKAPAPLTEQARRHALVGPPDLWRMKRAFQIRFLRDVGLRPDQDLMEIGCGTLRGGIPLIDYLETGRYVGFEIREKVLEEGRKELQEAGLGSKEPLLLHAPDILQVRIDRRFDVIWAFSVLFHMEDDILEDALAFVRTHLSEGGAFYANANVGEAKSNRWQGFPEVWRSLDFYRRACAQNGLSLLDMGPLRDLGHVTQVDAQDEQRMFRITAAN